MKRYYFFCFSSIMKSHLDLFLETISTKQCDSSFLLPELQGTDKQPLVTSRNDMQTSKHHILHNVSLLLRIGWKVPSLTLPV